MKKNKNETRKLFLLLLVKKEKQKKEWAAETIPKKSCWFSCFPVYFWQIGFTQ
jgi:hypothetical protein